MKIPTDSKKVHTSNPKKYRGNKTQNKPSPELKTETDLQRRCTDLGGYTFDLGPRASNKSARTMKELELYLVATYSDSCNPAIMTETAATFPDP